MFFLFIFNLLDSALTNLFILIVFGDSWSSSYIVVSEDVFFNGLVVGLCDVLIDIIFSISHRCFRGLLFLRMFPDFLRCINATLGELTIKLIDVINVLEDLVLSLIVLCLTGLLDGLSLMLLDVHLLINRFFIELQLGVFSLLEILLLSRVVSGLSVSSPLVDLLLTQSFNLQSLPILAWVLLDQEAFEGAIDQLKLVADMRVIDSVKKINDAEVFDGDGVDLQHAV